jgi:hypothetical protein
VGFAGFGGCCDAIRLSCVCLSDGIRLAFVNEA